MLLVVLSAMLISVAWLYLLSEGLFAAKQTPEFVRSLTFRFGLVRLYEAVALFILGLGAFANRSLTDILVCGAVGVMTSLLQAPPRYRLSGWVSRRLCPDGNYPRFFRRVAILAVAFVAVSTLAGELRSHPDRVYAAPLVKQVRERMLKKEIEKKPRPVEERRRGRVYRA